MKAEVAQRTFSPYQTRSVQRLQVIVKHFTRTLQKTCNAMCRKLDFSKEHDVSLQDVSCSSSAQQRYERHGELGNYWPARSGQQSCASPRVMRGPGTLAHHSQRAPTGCRIASVICSAGQCHMSDLSVHQASRHPAQVRRTHEYRV